METLLFFVRFTNYYIYYIIEKVIYMINQEKIEEIFDIINEGCVYLYDKFKMNYLDSVLLITKNIMDSDTIDMDEEFVADYVKILDKFGSDYNVEEIRKALQYVTLNAFKEIRYDNQITPDSIVVFFNYLIDKLFKKQGLAILDPMVGSGNLLLGIANSREESILYGIDNEEIMINVAKMFGDMIEPINLYYQDTLSVRLKNMDLIVSDIPCDVDLTYDVICYHLDSLKENGYMVLLIDNEFFTKVNEEKKKQINEVSTMLGIVELPEEFFKQKQKSIVIIKKSKEPIKDFLLAKMPKVSDMDAMNKFIKKIELWFVNGGK